MYLKRTRWYGVVAVMLFLTPLFAMAQIQIQLPPHWPPFPDEPRPRPPEHFDAEPRGFLEVINDWQDEVPVTVWSHHREQIGTWSIPAGQLAVFEVDGERIKVRPRYKIKVGDDWGWVD